MRKFLLSVCLLLVGLAGVSARSAQDEGEAKRVASDYFQRQIDGQSVGDLFCGSEDGTTLFNVKSFSYLGSDCDSFECKAKVRVDSTNRGGGNVTNTWVVAVRTRERSCIRTIYKDN